MGLFWTIVLGGLVGWIASLLTDRDAKQGWIANVLVGVGGSLVANFLFNGGNLVFDLGSLFVALIGAVILSVILNLIQSRKKA